jgi:hypothetical protein
MLFFTSACSAAAQSALCNMMAEAIFEREGELGRCVMQEQFCSMRFILCMKKEKSDWKGNN